MTMTPGLRKFALTSHVTSSVSWLGAVAAFLVLAVAGLSSRDDETVRAAYIAMHLTTWFVIVPLSLAALLTGLVQSLGTTWGLFRHYWIATKLLLTVLATITLPFVVGWIPTVLISPGEVASCCLIPSSRNGINMSL